MSAASPMSPLRPLPRSLTRIATAKVVRRWACPSQLHLAWSWTPTARPLTITSRCRALAVCEMDGGALVAQREHLAHADDKSQHSVICGECCDCSAARTSCSHRAVKATPSGACTALADDPRGAHALDLCRSSWWLQRLWMKRVCWLCSVACHQAHAEAGRVRAEAIRAFSTFTYHILTQLASRVTSHSSSTAVYSCTIL